MRELYGIFSSFLRTAGVLTATAWGLNMYVPTSQHLSVQPAVGYIESSLTE